MCSCTLGFLRHWTRVWFQVLSDYDRFAKVSKHSSTASKLKFGVWLWGKAYSGVRKTGVCVECLWTQTFREKRRKPSEDKGPDLEGHRVKQSGMFDSQCRGNTLGEMHALVICFLCVREELPLCGRRYKMMGSGAQRAGMHTSCTVPQAVVHIHWCWARTSNHLA